MKHHIIFALLLSVLAFTSCKKEKTPTYIGEDLVGIYRKDLSASDIEDKKRDDIIVSIVGDSLFTVERNYTKIESYANVVKKLVDGTVIDDILSFFGLGVDDASQWEHQLEGDYRLEFISGTQYRGQMIERKHTGNVQGAGALNKSFKLNEFSIVFNLTPNSEGLYPVKWDNQTFYYSKE